VNRSTPASRWSEPAFPAALAALRDIGWPHIRAALLLGLAVWIWHLAIFSSAIMYAAKSMPLPWLLLGPLISKEIVAFCVMAAIVMADRLVDQGAPRRRTYALAATVACLVGALASTPVEWAWHRYVLLDRWPAEWHWLRGSAFWFFSPFFMFTQWLPAAGAAVFLYADRRAARRTANLLHAAELDRIRRSRIALESRLQAMQARVEPQFLFNTLAQVGRLYEVDPAIAARMLDELIAYLRAAMPHMRDTSSTVAREVELARAYLDIVRLRLGDRLSVSIDMPAATREVRMPPMMLLPLVDHAVVRGLEHRSGAGTIAIVAAVDTGRLRLRILDTGSAIVPDVDDAGIDTIKERLDALYRGDATLELRHADTLASEAILDLPLEDRSPPETVEDHA
jgi:hypothetical protein